MNRKSSVRQTPSLIGRYIDAQNRWPRTFAQGVRGAKKKLTAKDALAMTGVPIQAFDTGRKKHDCVGAFLRWAENQFYLPYGERLARMLPSKGKQSIEQSRNKPYTKRELAILFQSEEYRAVSFVTPALYWIPLICMYTGLRLNEGCQQFVSDIKRDESGILYFDVTTEWDDSDYDPEEGPKPENLKRLKSRAAKRKVPIPQILLDIGFLDYVEFVQSLGCQRLFPDLKFEEKSGYGRLPSAEWREYTKRHDVYEKKRYCIPRASR